MEAEGGFRPLADLQPFSAMLRCGPSDRTFAARAKFDNGRTHSLRTNRPFAGAAIADAENVRICRILATAMQLMSPKRSLIPNWSKPTAADQGNARKIANWRCQ
jgi:hypothetical protein